MKTKQKNINSNLYIINECKKILNQQPNEQTNKWFIENKITSYALRYEKANYTIELSNQIFHYLLHHENQSFLQRLTHLLNNNIKSYQFCRFIKHFSQRDYEFEYINQIVKGKTTPSIPFYLHCRSCIVGSFLNKTNKQLMSGIVAEENQWFKVMLTIFKKYKEDQLIDIFIDVVKEHYKKIKKNQNDVLNGGQLFRIAQLMKEYIDAPNDQQQYTQKYTEIQPTHRHLKSENKPLTKNIVNDLGAEDRQFIRALSYKDDNVAALLEKKHNKIIDLITDDVEEMRRDIDEQKKKYIQLMRQKDKIIKETKMICELALAYTGKHSQSNENKLIEAISKFSHEHLEKKIEIDKIYDAVKEKRLIELIEEEELEIN